jgi:DNA-binding transcriptional LysR family regulator
VPLLPDYGTPEMEIVALYPHRRQLSTKVRLFLDMLANHSAEQHRWLDAMPDR